MGLRLQGKLPPEFDTAVFDDLGAAQEVALRSAPLPLDAPGFEEAVAAGLAGFAALPKGSLTVAPGLVVLSGGEMTPEIGRAIEGVRGGIPDGYELRTSFVAPDDGVELSVVVAKVGTDLVLTGHVPRDFSVDNVYAHLEGVGQDQTTRSPYPDLQGWSDPLWAGLTALAVLEEGQVSLSADGLKITGVAANPESRQRARRALGVAGQLEVQLLDDGAPPAYVLEFDAGAGASVQGKLPSGLSVALMAEALGLEAIRGRVTVSPDGAETRTIALLTALRPILSYVEGLRVEMSATDLSLSVALTPGADPQAWRRTLGLVPAQVMVATAADAVLGARRAHLLRQESQVFAGGYWLPFVALMDQPELCNAADVPDIPFEAQSFALGLDAVWPLAHLAAVARSCAGTAGLSLDLQAVATGYEAPALNAQLARRRAEAVRQALIARGVPGDRITARSMDGAGDQIRAIWR
jgi:OOP family OmpA-OmpF porin